MKTKKLNLEKLVIAKISNMNEIKAGIGYSHAIQCNLTKRPGESVIANGCETQYCEIQHL